MTHKLEVEREGNMSDHGCNYKRRVETTYVLDVERRATCHVAVTTTERGYIQRTGWTWRRRMTCQIAVVTTKRKAMTNQLNVEWKGDMSDCG